MALFYAAVTPIAVLNPVARQLSAAQGKSLSENAHDFALLNMAISDGAVATFDTKYHYNFWRPETAIQSGGVDGNDKTDPDATFMPFIIDSLFPGLSIGSRDLEQCRARSDGRDLRQRSPAPSPCRTRRSRE